LHLEKDGRVRRWLEKNDAGSGGKIWQSVSKGKGKRTGRNGKADLR
jgi:hypothetical protein